MRNVSNNCWPLLLLGMMGSARASDHLDTPRTIADPAADIGDIYAWMSPDGRRLNLIMTIVGRRFSDRLQYVFHIDSGPCFGETTATTSIVCRFDAAGAVDCRAGDADSARGDAGVTAGLEGNNRRFRVFAGLRDDPFFNNVKGARAALETAAAALRDGARRDATGCPAFDRATAQTILDRLRHSGDGPAQNFLAGWKTAALVISIDLGIVNAGGTMLAVWGATYKGGDGRHIGAPIDRAARALTANALIGPIAPGEVSDRRKEAYNRAGPAQWPAFAADIEASLPLYDAFDGICGNQWVSGREPDGPSRYRLLSRVLADDRLWIDSRFTVCKQYLAVELAQYAEPGASRDCGGRTPDEDVVDVFRSLLVRGTTTGVSDGVDRDDRVHSTTEFPFLAAP